MREGGDADDIFLQGQCSNNAATEKVETKEEECGCSGRRSAAYMQYTENKARKLISPQLF